MKIIILLMAVIFFSQTLKGFDYSIEAIAAPKANQYAIRIKFLDLDPQWHHLEVSRRKSNSSFTKQVLVEKDGAFWDLNVESHSFYEYQFLILNPQGQLLRKLLAQVTVPQDLVIQGSHSLNAPTDWQVFRIFLEENSKIITHGYPLNIEAAHFFSQESKIESGALSSNQSQRPVQIFSKTGSGFLQLHLSAQNGKNGAPGKNGTVGASGTKGQNAEYRLFTNEAICTRQPLRGANGAPGKAGNNGDPGEPGGNIEGLQIEFVEGSSFHFSESLSPGKGGVGGVGGLGGPGGAGGPPGDTFPCCDTAISGEPGPRGPNGSAGATGPSGKVLNRCVRMGVVNENNFCH